MATIHKADPGTRARALRLFVAVAAAGLVAAAAVEHFREDWSAWLQARMHGLRERPIRVLPVTPVLVAPVQAVAVWLLVHGRRVVRARRYPAPGRS